jgi:hypothetical protein
VSRLSALQDAEKKSLPRANSSHRGKLRLASPRIAAEGRKHLIGTAPDRHLDENASQNIRIKRVAGRFKCAFFAN